jgi:hypothetical protein
MDSTTLFLGLIFGSVGAGYFLYGRKQKRLVPLVSGVCLFVVPYAVSNNGVLAAIGVVLMALPFVLKL